MQGTEVMETKPEHGDRWKLLNKQFLNELEIKI